MSCSGHVLVIPGVLKLELEIEAVVGKRAIDDLSSRIDSLRIQPVGGPNEKVYLENEAGADGAHLNRAKNQAIGS